jgi:hypothetical protein
MAERLNRDCGLSLPKVTLVRVSELTVIERGRGRSKSVAE